MRADNWTRFVALQPLQRRLYAVVEAHNADGTASIRFPDGGTARVAGALTAAVPYGVFVRAGRIEQQAPALPAYELEV